VGEAGTGQLVDVDSDVGLLGLLFCVRGRSIEELID
jgi:hypothetical protein